MSKIPSTDNSLNTLPKKSLVSIRAYFLDQNRGPYHMNKTNLCNCCWAILLFSLLAGCSKSNTVRLSSPGDSFVLNLEVDSEHSAVYYSIDFKGNPVITKAALGFELATGQAWPEELAIAEVITRSVNTSWQPVYGERNEYPDHYNEAFVRFRGANTALISLRVRAYEEGIAFRYEFLDQEGDTQITEELTEFQLPATATAWVSSRAQSEITKTKVADIAEAKERPMLIQYTDSLFVAIGEAALVDYARMKLINKQPGSGTLKAQLEGEVSQAGAFNTPWRFIMAAQQPAQLLENNFLLLNLNEPNEIADVSWIKPGKVIREVTLTTQGGMACVDFAVKHKLQYIEFDAGWYGNEYDDASDATTITVDPKRSPGPLELLKVIDYAKEQGVGVILYVNRRALEKQLDEVLPLLESWGVAGVKYGFVNVGPQEWTSWLHEAVRKAADHQLMIDVHDEYRPTGYSRTYPNFMTQEGIRGDEESTPNDGVINTLFTRMIAGAGDQTNCYFADRVTEKMGSHASQMAKAICIYSPWQFLYWYDRPVGSPSKKGGAGGAQTGIPEIPDLRFYDQLPTVWDDTRVLAGYPGELAVVARKDGDRWFLGAITGTKAHALSLPLDFLDPALNYRAEIFAHDESLGTRTKIKIEEMEVKQGAILTKDILQQNGLAVIFTPI